MQEQLVSKTFHLNKSAKDAYRGYIASYDSHSMKDVFNVHRLDLKVIIYLFIHVNNSCTQLSFHINFMKNESYKRDNVSLLHYRYR